MAACARKEIVRKGEPGIYHIWQRCVRRAWLFGVDPLTGKDYTDRRDWIAQRMEFQASCFAIDICFMAIMSNHFHLVLRALPDIAKGWTDEEVARRWLRLCPGKLVLDGVWIEPTQEQVEELAKDKRRIKKLRRRLSNVSWFSGRLSEYIARRANAEDLPGRGEKGRFFQGRFGCRECTNEASLLICGMYVDLNQVRAGEASSLEGSRQCSIWWRLMGQKPVFDSAESPAPVAGGSTIDGWLAKLSLEPSDLGVVPSTAGRRASDKGLLSVSFDDYIRLLQFAGECKVPEKPGVLAPQLAPIIERLGLSIDDLADTVKNFPNLFRRIAGSARQMAQRARDAGRRWFQGIRAARRVFREAPENASS